MDTNFASLAHLTLPRSAAPEWLRDEENYYARHILPKVAGAQRLLGLLRKVVTQIVGHPAPARHIAA